MSSKSGPFGIQSRRTARSAYNNIGNHPQALISHFEPIINRKNQIQGHQGCKSQVHCLLSMVSNFRITYFCQISEKRLVQCRQLIMFSTFGVVPPINYFVPAQCRQLSNFPVLKGRCRPLGRCINRPLGFDIR